MTVSKQTPVNNYAGNSSNKKFDFDFLINDSQELVVKLTDKNNVIRVLKEGLDYSINEIGNKNGSYIIFPLDSSTYDVLKEDELISLSLELEIKQESEFKNSSYFNFNILEFTFDYIVRILQILNRKIERCLKVEEGSSAVPDTIIDNINEAKKVTEDYAKEVTKMRDSVLSDKQNVETNKNIVNEKLKDLNSYIEDVKKKSNKDLSDLSETGELHFLNKRQVTNCILEKTNTITKEGLTIKINSGLNLLISDGRNPDGTLKNIEYKVTSQLSFVMPALTGEYEFFGQYNKASNKFDSILYIEPEKIYLNKQEPFSADSENKGFWFNPIDNKWKITDASDKWEEKSIISLGRFKQNEQQDEFENFVVNKPLEVLNKTEMTISYFMPAMDAGVEKAWDKEHTAECDGWLHTGNMLNVNQIHITINGVRSLWIGVGGTDVLAIQEWMPIPKGTQYKFDGGVNNSDRYIKFYPLKGVIYV